jgi:hypothetical protein
VATGDGQCEGDGTNLRDAEVFGKRELQGKFAFCISL